MPSIDLAKTPSFRLDGKRALETNAYRACVLGDERVRIPLEAGRHELVLRVNQGTGDWALAIAAAVEGDGTVRVVDAPAPAP